MKLFQLKGGFIGFLLGAIIGYFLGFGLIFHLAETGNFKIYHLLIFFVFPFVGFLVGYKINRYILIKKNKK